MEPLRWEAALERIMDRAQTTLGLSKLATNNRELIINLLNLKVILMIIQSREN